MENSTKKDQYTTVLENIRDDFKVFGEKLNSLMGLNKKFDKLQETVDEHSVKLDVIEGVVKGHSKDLDLIKSHLGIQSPVNGIAQVDRISRLESRVTKLEKTA